MKLTFEDKKEICRLYNEEFLSYPKISKIFKIGETTVKRIINRCKEHGEESLRHPAKKRIFSADFKMIIINKVYEGESKEAIAVKYSLAGPGTIDSWMHKYEEFGYNGLVTKRKGRPKKNMNQKIEDKQIVCNMSSPLTDPERAEFEELKKKYATLKKAKEQTDMENDLLKKLDALIQKRQKKEEKIIIRVIYELRHKYPLVSLLKFTKISKSSYFYEINTYKREDKDEAIKEEIKEIFEYNKKRYGSPRVTLELNKRGIKINHKKVERLMRVMNLKGKQPRGHYNSYKGENVQIIF